MPVLHMPWENPTFTANFSEEDFEGGKNPSEMPVRDHLFSPVSKLIHEAVMSSLGFASARHI